jgi:hypothetical protein
LIISTSAPASILATIVGGTPRHNDGQASAIAQLRYTGLINLSFARIYVLFAGVAILLWSMAMLRDQAVARVLSVYALLLGATLAAGACAGYLRLDVHGFGMIALAQGSGWRGWRTNSGVRPTDRPSSIARVGTTDSVGQSRRNMCSCA